jgi:hypothetical protein
MSHPIDGAIGSMASSRSWQRWRGHTAARTSNGVVRTPEDDANVLVLPVTVQDEGDGESIKTAVLP